MDWLQWHADYEDPQSELSQRLRTVQRHITAWLDARPDPALRVISVCAGQGRDLIEVLQQRPADADRVTATLLEWDSRNVAYAQASATGLRRLTVVQADAGDWASYAALGRADLLMLVGIFGNITDEDIARTVASIPQLCRPDATVIWTLSRWEQRDGTGYVRELLRDNGCVETAFDAPGREGYSVGVARFAGAPVEPPGQPAERLFTFTR